MGGDNAKVFAKCQFCSFIGGEPSFGKKSVTLHLSLHDLMDGFTMLRLCYTCTIDSAVLKISNRKTSGLFYLSVSRLPIQCIWCCFLNKICVLRITQ